MKSPCHQRFRQRKHQCPSHSKEGKKGMGERKRRTPIEIPAVESFNSNHFRLKSSQMPNWTLWEWSLELCKKYHGRNGKSNKPCMGGLLQGPLVCTRTCSQAEGTRQQAWHVSVLLLLEGQWLRQLGIPRKCMLQGPTALANARGPLQGKDREMKN